MSFWGKLFGSDKVIDAAIATGDKMFHTSEEKAEDYLRVMEMYQAFKVAQRFLALIFSIPYALAWFITFLCSFKWDVATQQALLDGDISRIVMAIVGFYFLGGAAEGAIRGVNWLKKKKDD
jgi:hypothetical protein